MTTHENIYPHQNMLISKGFGMTAVAETIIYHHSWSPPSTPPQR